MVGNTVWGRAPCSEFPNDNPALHGGSSWFASDERGRLSCVLPTKVQTEEADAQPVAVVPEAEPVTQPELDHAVNVAAFEAELEEEPGLIEVVEELSVDGMVDEFEPSTEALACNDGLEGEEEGVMSVPSEPPPAEEGSPAPTDPFARLVFALEETALSLGARAPGVACVRALFGTTRWDAIDPGAQAIDALLAGQIIVRSESRHGLARASAFTEQVLAWQAILRGESEDFAVCTALDEWAADVVARVLGNPARADAIRRELRGRGVAAFGLVAEAA
jgi:hypothetical protein